VSGRKRHLLVDTEGLVLKPIVHPADQQDGTGARPLLVARAGLLSRLQLVWVDGGSKKAFAACVAATLGRRVEMVQHPEAGRRYVWVVPAMSRRRGPPASGSCPGAGRWSGRLPGWGGSGA
jgi:putative transposase